MTQALMSAHVPTMLLMVLIVSGVMAVAVLVVGLGQTGNAGLLWWGAAMLLNTMAYALYVMAAEDAGPWLVVAAYWVQSADCTAALKALPASFGWKVHRTWLWLPFTLVAVLSVAFAHDEQQAIRLVELVLAVQVAMIGWVALKGDPPVGRLHVERSRWIFLAGIGFGVLGFLQRVVIAWSDAPAAIDLVSSDAWQTATYVQGTACLLLSTIGLVLMHKEHADAQAQRANARLVEVERERARLDERKRLLQDVHDGFGSQLATARLRALDADLTPAQMEEMLRECLDDLHLVIDTLNSADSSLENALIDYRHRMQQRLAKLPIAIEWQLALEHCPPLDERVILQLLRIVQEALANALKHAKAARIVIGARCDAVDGLQVVVADEGSGMPANVRHGRGVDSMRGRARDIGADLRWETDANGTRVLLGMPHVRVPATA
ncbi:MAG: hypothetical protein U1F10_10285 [Burkholderiales bacterium]